MEKHRNEATLYGILLDKKNAKVCLNQGMKLNRLRNEGV